MKDSPAACATLGHRRDPPQAGVFALSAAMAGVGGALYAGTLGSVAPNASPRREPAPPAAGGGRAASAPPPGALFAGAHPGRLPDRGRHLALPGNLNRLLPGTMGVALGRNPNGAVRDIARRYGDRPPGARHAVRPRRVAGAGRRPRGHGAIAGGHSRSAAVALVAWPQVAEVVVRRRQPTRCARALEWAGLDRPLTADELRDDDVGLAPDRGGRRDARSRSEEVSVSFGGRLALQDVDLDGRGRSDHRAHRSQRCRQDDAVQRDLRPAGAHPRRVPLDDKDVTGWPRTSGPGAAWRRTFQRLELFGCSPCARTSARRRRRPTPGSRRGGRRAARPPRARPTSADQRADRLPTGQARVVELARALATEPTVLLLDEPASGQDERETAAFSTILRDVAAEGVAVRARRARRAARDGRLRHIHVLDLGRVLAAAPRPSVQQDHAVLGAYLGGAP